MSERERLEDVRQGIHSATGVLAGLLRWLSPAGAAALGLALVVHNVVAMPRWARALHRGPVDPGILSYPVVVLGLVLAFRGRPELAAAAWGLLAFGDGAANLAGRHLGGPRLPWNPAKTVTGLVAFILIGAPAAAGLLAFVSDRGPAGAVPFGRALVPVGGAALVAGLAESVRSRMDDNVRVAVAGAVVLAVSFGAVPGLDPAGWAAASGRALVAVPASLLLAIVAVGCRVASPGGAAAGAVLIAVMAAAGGWGPGAAFAAFVIVASAATRIGRARKRALGLEEGRRTARHAVANGGVAAGLALAALLTGRPAWGLGAIAAAATAAFDTVATEIGPLASGRPLRLATLERVPAGTPGGVSVAGTLAGVVAAVAVAAAGVAAAGVAAAGVAGGGLLGAAAQSADPGLPGAIPVPGAGGAAVIVGVTLAAALAGMLESLLAGAGAPLGHHARNALNTAAGAGLALAIVEV